MNGRAVILMLAALLSGALAGCSTSPRISDDVSSRIRRALDNAGLTEVSAGYDPTSRAVTLSGRVPAEDARMRAQSIARSIVEGAEVSNEIAVAPARRSGGSKVVTTNLDHGISKNLDDALEIFSELEPDSTCQKYTDVYLKNDSSRRISVKIKRSNSMDSDSRVLTYTINPDPSTPRWMPWAGSGNSKLKIGCLFEGSKAFTYQIVDAAYL